MTPLIAKLKDWFGLASFGKVKRCSYEDIRHIHLRRFSASDPARFTRLWCEIAAICRVSPMELDESVEIAELFPVKSGQVWPNYEFDRLEFLIVDERRLRSAVGSDLATVGEVLDYLLFSDSGEPIFD